MPPRSINVHGRSYESLATDQTDLRYPPPLAERASDPPGFEFWWKMLEFVFALPDPTTCPRLLTAPTGRDAAVIKRYLSAAEEMAESEALGSNAGFTVHVADDQSGIERLETSDFPSKENTRGFATLFRQFDSPKEPAGFLQVQRVLRQADGAHLDERAPERLAQLKAWGKARGRLHGANLKVLVGQKLRDQGRMAGPIPGEDDTSPAQLISGYQYGDLIHWGDDSTLLAVASDPFLRVRQQLAFLEAVSGLIHVYLGFSVLVRAIVDP